MSKDYDDTNRGAIFKPKPDMQLTGQGKLNVDGKDYDAMVVKREISAAGRVESVLYVRAGVLWANDDKKSENSPDKSGRLDIKPGWGVSAWAKQSESGTKYLSLAADDWDARKAERDGDPGRARPEDDSVPIENSLEDDGIPF